MTRLLTAFVLLLAVSWPAFAGFIPTVPAPPPPPSGIASSPGDMPTVPDEISSVGQAFTTGLLEIWGFLAI